MSSTEADAVVLQYLEQRQLYGLANAFAQATQVVDRHRDLPSLTQLLELWAATHGKTEGLDTSLENLSIGSSIQVPEKPTTTLCDAFLYERSSQSQLTLSFEQERGTRIKYPFCKCLHTHKPAFQLANRGV